jgi:hypothetical protein
MAKLCGVPTKDRYCEEFPNRETGDGFCEAHTRDWRNSAEFQEAKKDPAVAFAASLRIPKMLTAALRPFKKKWMKRLAAEFDGEES